MADSAEPVEHSDENIMEQLYDRAYANNSDC